MFPWRKLPACGRSWHRKLEAYATYYSNGANIPDDPLLVVDDDLDLIDTTRTRWPFLRDRRIDAYGDLTRRYLDG